MKSFGLCVLAVLVCLVSCTQSPDRSVAWRTGSVRSADGVQISYQTAGEGSVAVVFVHGWSCDRSYWREQLDSFAQDYRVVAVDLAGHGASGQDREEWALSAFGEDVVAVINDLGLDRVVLVGHSMGGPVIVETALIVPDVVIGVVGVDALQDPDAPGMTHDAMQGPVRPFEESFPEAMRNLVSAVMFVPQSDSTLKAWIVEDMASAPPVVGLGALRSTLQWPVATRFEALTAFRIPVRLINASLFPTDLAAAERYGIEVEIMSGVGHFNMMEDAESFNDLLSSAIADLATR